MLLWTFATKCIFMCNLLHDMTMYEANGNDIDGLWIVWLGGLQGQYSIIVAKIVATILV
jgi:hypothetical protein